MILIDNYDSFTYNIVQSLMEMGIEPKVFKNDEVSLKKLENINFDRIIISPGPGNPDNAGISLDVIKRFHKTKKILGVCLGHQCIAQFFGASICMSKNPTHEKVSEIFFDENCELFKNISQGFQATRYHSLEVERSTITDTLIPIANTKDNVNMAIKCKDFNVYGVQFHPESILTIDGKILLKNFANI
ncbi:aminodeoxychorismate/anthranilate synthase component II [Candidatus Endomicrobiellum devescovinae]|uniref:anthranilate synthase component II n=1 Tax=Candidatus Endomicrobiellum devescovinae TaxID=3242322 RepID=UPI00281A091D|nr:aminodeoxychorismate/anthranilate synthase component II [Endomicrobium sp.]